MEAAHFQAARNGDVRKYPFCSIPSEDLNETFNKVSPSGNSLLHVASSSGHEEMTQLIAQNFPILITKQNSEGNTALHLAVRAHKLNTVRALAYLSEPLLTMINVEGNTALHEALFAISDASKKNVDSTLVEMARCLGLNNPDVTCHQNKAGKSPLCMAVESGEEVIVEDILNALPDQGDGLLQRLQGKSPAHVAIQHRKLDMLKIIKEKKRDLLPLRDEEGNTPLHFAASIGWLEGVRDLLDFESNWALERNNKGYYPLHLACENGHIEVTEVLFQKWPDPTELLCNKGQNILHAAVKSGKDNMVRYVLKRKGTNNLVSKMDRNGNTPSHLAALLGHSMIVFTLRNDKRSIFTALNYHGLTAFDIFEAKVKDQEIDDVHDRNLEASGVEENSVEVDSRKYGKLKKFQMVMVCLWLLYFYKEEISRHHRNSTKTSHIKIKPSEPKQDLNNTINYLFVVAALVVGAAFSGALQIPYDSGNGSTDDVGIAPTASSTPTKLLLTNFLFSNIVTMLLAVIAAFGLFTALLVDANLASMLVSVSFLLLEISLISMGTAFLYAMQLRMTIVKEYQLSILHTVLGVFEFILVLLITVLFFASGEGKGLALIIYLTLFCFYFPLYRLWSIISSTPLKIVLKSAIWGLFFAFISFVVSFTPSDHFN